MQIVTDTPEPIAGRRAEYRVPAAIDERPDGFFICDWSLVQRQSGAPGRQPQPPASSYNAPRPILGLDWDESGEHALVCQPRFVPHRGPGRSPSAQPPETPRLELAVHVRTLENLSRSRFDRVASPAAYEAARLAPDIEDEEARRRPAQPGDAAAAERRRERIAAMDQHAGMLDPQRRVTLRGSLTSRDGRDTVPLAL